jgi:hypothetical protein
LSYNSARIPQVVLTTGEPPGLRALREEPSMPCRTVSRRAFLQTAGLICGLSGCGTIFYPERRGQPAGMLDWKVVALDAVGLLFFFVPGVIAFAVDFNNGTIYLPPGQCADGLSPDQKRLTSRRVPRGELSIARLQREVSAHLQSPFELTPGGYETHELASVDEFWDTAARCERAGHSSPSVSS